jgi:NAD-dependent SIR2 family protein deacetylase
MKILLGKVNCPACRGLYSGWIHEARNKRNSLYIQCQKCKSMLFGPGVKTYIDFNSSRLDPGEWSVSDWDTYLEEN